jgi:hypothetical protein
VQSSNGAMCYFLTQHHCDYVGRNGTLYQRASVCVVVGKFDRNVRSATSEWKRNQNRPATGVSSFQRHRSHEDGNRSRFRKVVFFSVFRIPDDGQSPKPQSVTHRRQSSSESTSIINNHRWYRYWGFERKELLEEPDTVATNRNHARLRCFVSCYGMAPCYFAIITSYYLEKACIILRDLGNQVVTDIQRSSTANANVLHKTRF